MQFMVTNRNLRGGSPPGGQAAGLSYWVRQDLAPPIDDIQSWQRASRPQFREALRAQAAADQGPLDLAHHEEQKHLTLLIHGYNNSWASSVHLYEKVWRRLYVKGRVI